MNIDVKNFEIALKNELDIIYWDVSERQLINMAKDIASYDAVITRKKLAEIILNNGVEKYYGLGLEGLNFGRMMALLKAAKDVANNNDSDE